MAVHLSYFIEKPGASTTNPMSVASSLPLLRNITRFELRYLDPQTGEWRDDWDSTGVETNNRLPRAVQMVINLQHEEPLEPHDVKETTHVRTIILETAPRTQSVLSGGQGGMNNNQSLGFRRVVQMIRRLEAICRLVDAKRQPAAPTSA